MHGEVERIALPKIRRKRVIELAHDRLDHLGYRKVTQTLKIKFACPLMSNDVRDYCLSCNVSQKSTRASQRKVPMCEKPVLAEPFEVVALDIVGPLPKGKGGVEYVLTAICMATRWPEAIYTLEINHG